MANNPWNVDSLEAFTFLKCPECTFDTKETDLFQNHAIYNHPLSYVLFSNISKVQEVWTDPVRIKQESNPDIVENWNEEYDFKNSVLPSNSVKVKIEDLQTNELEPKYHTENDPDFSLQKKRKLKTNRGLRGEHPYQCPKCEYSFLTEEKLKIHTGRVHTKKKMIKRK